MSTQSQQNITENSQVVETNSTIDVSSHTARPVATSGSTSVAKPSVPKKLHLKQGLPRPKAKVSMPDAPVTPNTNESTLETTGSGTTNIASTPKGPAPKKKKKKFAKTHQIAVNPDKSVAVSPSSAPTDLFESGFQLVSLKTEDVSDSTRQMVMAHAFALPNALQPLINQMQQNGLYRLYIPDPVLAERFARGDIYLSRCGDGATTSLSEKGGYVGSANIKQVGSAATTAISTTFAVLSMVTFQFYLRTINKQLSEIQQQLQAIINHLEIKSLARFNTCHTKLWELMEDFCALVDYSSVKNPAGDLEKQCFINQLSFVEQICKELAEETKLALKMKRQELDDLVSKKTKIDEKNFEKCGPIIEQSICAHRLKVILLNLIVQKDKQWTPTTLPLNERRLKAASDEIKDILDFTEHVKQLANNEEKSRSLLTKIKDVITAHVAKEDSSSKYEPVKAKFDALGEQLTSTAKSYLIYFDREQNSAKILPELK